MACDCILRRIFAFGELFSDQGKTGVGTLSSGLGAAVE
jgi:hypothetical protein